MDFNSRNYLEIGFGGNNPDSLLSWLKAAPQRYRPDRVIINDKVTSDHHQAMNSECSVRDEIRAIGHWVVTSSLGPTLDGEFLSQFCVQIRQTGLPLARLQLGWRTLHPTVEALSMCWSRADGLQDIQFHSHGSSDDRDNTDWQFSPFKFVLDQRLSFFRRSLTGAEPQLDFPILKLFRDQGLTDYLILTIPFGPPPEVQTPYDGALMSWCGDAAGGFSDRDVAEIRFLSDYLGLALKLAVRDRVAVNALTAYLGDATAKRVLGGKIRLGDGELISAVILYCDLRQSTRLAAQLSGAEYLKTLNQFFQCSAGAVIEAGGEVLRFIGDGILAIFPLAEGACRRALAAAEETERRISELNRQRLTNGLQPLSYGLGLHTGEVMHGNIGIPERLDFSVTGPAANEAARIEDLTKSLGYRVLASRLFVENAPGDWVSLGRHTLRGAASKLELFGLVSTRSASVD